MSPKKPQVNLKGKIWTEEEILKLWPQAEAELSGFRQILEIRAGLTASQLSMAIQMANQQFKNMFVIPGKEK